MATVSYAVLDPDSGQLRVSSAGHLPPVIAAPGQRGAVAQIAVDPPIGVADARRRQVTTLALAPGAVLCLFTDGLVERRDEPVDIGITRLCQAVTPGPPEDVCVSLMHALIGSQYPGDDVALLVLRWLPGPAPASTAPALSALIGRPVSGDDLHLLLCCQLTGLRSKLGPRGACERGESTSAHRQQGLPSAAGPGGHTPLPDPLTGRELVVPQLLRGSLSRREIAAELAGHRTRSRPRPGPSTVGSSSSPAAPPSPGDKTPASSPPRGRQLLRSLLVDSRPVPVFPVQSRSLLSGWQVQGRRRPIAQRP
jgi:Stage II sporulation protein E (SpoIIE)